MAKALLYELGRSASFGRLTLLGKVLWPMLLASSDEQGRGLAEPDVLKWSVCPNVPELTLDNIPDALTEMMAQGMIHLYENESHGKLYQVVRWWEYQQLQWAHPSRLIAPEGWIDRIRFTIRGEGVTVDNWDTPGGFCEVAELSPLKILSDDEDENGMLIMTLGEIDCELQAFEQKHSISSQDFYNLWRAGKSPVHGTDKIRWVAFWEASREHRKLSYSGDLPDNPPGDSPKNPPGNPPGIPADNPPDVPTQLNSTQPNPTELKEIELKEIELKGKEGASAPKTSPPLSETSSYSQTPERQAALQEKHGRDPLDAMAKFAQRQEAKLKDRPAGWGNVSLDTWSVCELVANQFPCRLPVDHPDQNAATREMVLRRIDKWSGGAALLLEGFEDDVKRTIDEIVTFREHFDGGFTVAGPQSLLNSVGPGIVSKPKPKRGQRNEHEPATPEVRAAAWERYGPDLERFIEARGTDENLWNAVEIFAASIDRDINVAYAVFEAREVKRALAMEPLDPKTFFAEG